MLQITTSFSKITYCRLKYTDHKPSEKYFYSEILKTIGYNEAHKGTSSMMKECLINALISDSRETQYRRL